MKSSDASKPLGPSILRTLHHKKVSEETIKFLGFGLGVPERGAWPLFKAWWPGPLGGGGVDRPRVSQTPSHPLNPKP